MNSESPVNGFVWNHQYLEKFVLNIFLAGCPEEFNHRFMYIAPSSDCSLVTPHLPFKVILQRFKVVFWCLEWKCCTFQKIDENSFQSTNMLLKSDVTSPDHVVRCRGSQECGSRFVNFACQFHWRWHSLPITLKSTTLLFMRSSNAWTSPRNRDNGASDVWALTAYTILWF